MPDPASSFFVGNAPQGANYAAPLLSFAPLAGLADDFYRGKQNQFQQQQNQRTLALQQPVIDPNTGQPTTAPRAVIDAANQRGGLESAIQMLPLEQRQQFLDQLGGQGGSNNQTPPAGPSNVPSVTGPANIRGPSARPNSQIASPQQPAEIDMPGDGSVNNPYRPRNLSDFQQIDTGAYFVSPTGKIVPKGTGNASTPATQNGIPASPVPSSGASGAPAPTAGPGSENAAPATGIVPTAPSTQPAAAIVPPEYKGRELQYAQQQDQIADTLTSRAQQGEVLGYNTKAMLDQATAARARAQAVRDALTKSGEATLESQLRNSEKTTAQKEAEASGAGNPLNYSTQQEINKADVASGDKKYEAVQHQADEAANMVQTLKLNQSLMDDPGFYSGVGEPYQLFYARMKAALNLDPNAATPQEAFRKTVSSAILDQIRSLGGQGLGQVRVAEINVMKQAAQNEENTPASNRLLSEIQTRLATRWTMPLAELAQSYKAGGTVQVDGNNITLQKHGYLDTGWDKLKTQYMNSHPLFAPDELSDTRRISPPLARSPADLARIGWSDGMPFRTGRTLPNGQPEILSHAPRAAPAAPGQ